MISKYLLFCNCLKQELSVAAMFDNDQDEMSILYRGPAIDASYQVSVHLAKRFQRRRFFFKSANQIQKLELPMTAMFVVLKNLLL
jgi:hypothetical protein